MSSPSVLPTVHFIHNEPRLAHHVDECRRKENLQSRQSGLHVSALKHILCFKIGFQHLQDALCRRLCDRVFTTHFVLKDTAVVYCLWRPQRQRWDISGCVKQRIDFPTFVSLLSTRVITLWKSTCWDLTLAWDRSLISKNTICFCYLFVWCPSLADMYLYYSCITHCSVVSTKHPPIQLHKKVLYSFICIVL